MVKTLIQLIILFVISVLLQALIFNHLCLWGVAMPFAFLYFILRMPVTFTPIAVISLSFVLGLVVDIFSDTLGVNTLACTVAGASRKGVLKLYFPREEDMSVPVPSISSLGLGVYIKYALTMSLLYCLLFFFIDTFSIFNFPGMLLRIVASTVFTFVIVMCFECIIHSSEKRL